MLLEKLRLKLIRMIIQPNLLENIYVTNYSNTFHWVES